MLLITHTSISIAAQRQHSSTKLPGHMMQLKKLPSTYHTFAPFLFINTTIFFVSGII